MMDGNYDPASLRAGLEQCDKNIAVFKAAIKKEEDTKNQYLDWIKQIEEKKRIDEEVPKKISFNVNREIAPRRVTVEADKDADSTKLL